MYEFGKKGKWIDEHGEEVGLNVDGEVPKSCYCSKCGEWLIGSDEYACKGRYCPNCGDRKERVKC